MMWFPKKSWCRFCRFARCVFCIEGNTTVCDAEKRRGRWIIRYSLLYILSSSFSIISLNGNLSWQESIDILKKYRNCSIELNEKSSWSNSESIWNNLWLLKWRLDLYLALSCFVTTKPHDETSWRNRKDEMTKILSCIFSTWKDKNIDTIDTCLLLEFINNN